MHNNQFVFELVIKNEYSMEVSMMKEVRYMISDTAKKVDVEAHVLRYWEEELELTIGRTEMGHRYYTPDDIVLFKSIKELKEQGFQLKAIKMLLPELVKNKGQGIENLLLLREELNEKAGSMMAEIVTEQEKPESETQVVTVERKSGQVQVQDEKIMQFQEIIKNIVLDALQENNVEFQKEMGREVGDHVVKEVDYIMRMQDEKDEERFKRLDETIRSYQKTTKEVAVTKKEKKKHFRLSRKEKKASKSNTPNQSI